MSDLLNAWLSSDNAAPAAPVAPVARKAPAKAPRKPTQRRQSAPASPVASPASPVASPAKPVAAPAARPATIMFKGAHVRAVDGATRQRVISRSYGKSAMPAAPAPAEDDTAPVQASNGFSAVPMGQGDLYWAVDPDGAPVAMIRPADVQGQWHKVDLCPAVWADFSNLPRADFIEKHLS